MNVNLKYRDEDDKCYGATGMTVALVVLDGDELISAVNLDATPDALMEYSDEFYFKGSPVFSAKSVWNTLLKHFNLSMAATMANVMCRRYMVDHTPVDDSTKRFLLKLMQEEGNNECELDKDETKHLFEKNYNYLTRVFSHQGVQAVCQDFADHLKANRRMTRNDVLDKLKALRML